MRVPGGRRTWPTTSKGRTARSLPRRAGSKQAEINVGTAMVFSTLRDGVAGPGRSRSGVLHYVYVVLAIIASLLRKLISEPFQTRQGPVVTSSVT